MRFSIIIPVLNEAPGLNRTLRDIAVLQAQGAEIVLVDGGSQDATVAIANERGFAAIPSDRGRARQMNTGARHASGDVLVFLHADTSLPRGALQEIALALQGGRHVWGRFDVRIEGRSCLLGAVALSMNWRSRFTGIATGDQAIFVTRAAFMSVGGYPDQPLMEDIEISKRLRRLSSPACIARRAITSGRRWDSYGVVRTIVLMWKLRWAYWRGVPASELARAYR
ncbi:MAG: TIGR04283 family arsenosugar biosynthesis glycosyltransferase [Steroidobacteraceae bacterium]